MRLKMAGAGDTRATATVPLDKEERVFWRQTHLIATLANARRSP
jgi:hypothetical protein